MADPIYCERAGHRTWFKWHRGRRRASDPVFTGARIVEGMRLGASVEVDLLVHRDRGFAVLHDPTVERETTGSGAVAQLGADDLRRLKLRDNNGQPTSEPVMLLEDLAGLLASSGIHSDALLQLDFKEDAAALDPEALDNFRRSIGPVAGHMILSSGDAEAVRSLTDIVTDLRVGYDPCHGDALEQLFASRDYAGFVEGAVAASPRAEMVYLAYPVVLEARDDGFDIVAAFHAHGRRIDAYTIKTADAATLPIVERLLACGVDQITTDDPEGLSALLACA